MESSKHEWLNEHDFFKTKPLVKLSDLKVIPDVKFVSLDGNCHLGQRKLLINEIEFYTNYLPSDGKGVIIYSGSAHGEHTPIILEMFPNVKIVMIDPNYHIMDYDYLCIYKRGEGNIKDILELEKKKGQRGNHLRDIIRMIKKKKCLDGNTYNLLKDVNFGNLNSEYLKDLIYNKKTCIDNFGYECRVFVIQDYMSKELASKLKDIGTIYISDIRTNLFYERPIMLDVLHNSALQANILEELRMPSHLKFVMPSLQELDNSLELIQNPSEHVKEMLKEIEFSKRYGFDFISDFVNDEFRYYKGEVYLQAWSGCKSRETRLVVTFDEKPEVIKYDIHAFKGKLLYFNIMRDNAFVKTNTIVKGYDNCVDCALEQVILKGYLSKFETKFTLEKLYDNITKYTFWSLNSNKCPSHGYFKKEKSRMIFTYSEDWVKKEIIIHK